MSRNIPDNDKKTCDASPEAIIPPTRGEVVTEGANPNKIAKESEINENSINTPEQ